MHRIQFAKFVRIGLPSHRIGGDQLVRNPVLEEQGDDGVHIAGDRP